MLAPICFWLTDLCPINRPSCFAKPHTKQERRNGVGDYKVGGIPLIIMRILFHQLSLQSDPFNQG